MMTKHLKESFLLAVIVCATAIPAAANNRDANIERWDFNVYLGSKKLGHHLFEVTNKNGFTRVRSEADFRYKILFVSAYRYKHRNSERWANNCLLDFEAQTDANGKQITAFGEKIGDSFEVVGEDGAADLPECVMTFAYWNPVFLEQQRLLNPQSGEYLDVEIEALPQAVLEVRGNQVTATPYKLIADDLELTVWYSTDNEWLGLESVAEGGKVLRYELS